MKARMAPPWAAWRHVTKLDPDRPLSDRVLEAVAQSGTDAVVLGGTGGLTREKVAGLLARVRRYPWPVGIEVSDPACLVPGADWYFVPVVLNAGDPEWLSAAHRRTLAELLRTGAPLDFGRVVGEGYVVQNPASAVGRLTRAVPAASPEEAAAAALYAVRLLGLPLVYFEYSGTFGDPELVRAARAALAAGPGEPAGPGAPAGPGGCRAAPRARLWYGGGVDGPARAAAMAAVADTVVVGNALYEAGPQALAATVRAVGETPPPG